MKKAVLIPLIVGASLLVTGSVIFGVAFANQKAIETETITYNLDKQFKNIVAKLNVSDVEFKISSESKIVFEQIKKHYVTADIQNETLLLNETDSRPWYEKMFGFYKIKTTIYLPETTFDNFALDSATGDIKIPEGYEFANLKINLSTGDVDVKSNIKEEANIKTSTGSISLEKANPTSLKLEASTGHISVKDVSTNGDAYIKTSTGGHTINKLKANNLDESASTGNINISNSLIEKHAKLHTSTGDIKFMESDAETLDVEASTGDIDMSLLSGKTFEVTTSTGKQSVPPSTSGAGLCKIKTSTGNINVIVK